MCAWAGCGDLCCVINTFPPNDMLMYLRFFLLLLGCGEASPDFRRTLGDSEAE